jgi:hypothetical protein
MFIRLTIAPTSSGVLPPVNYERAWAIALLFLSTTALYQMPSTIRRSLYPSRHPT